MAELPLNGGCQYVAYTAAWEPIPDDGLARFDEGRPGRFSAGAE